MASGTSYSFKVPVATPINEIDTGSDDSVFSESSSDKQLIRVSSSQLRSLPNSDALFISLSVLVGSLLEPLCSMIETTPEKSKELFQAICKEFEELKFLSPISHQDEYASIRSQYKSSFYRLIQTVRLNLDSRLSLPDSSSSSFKSGAGDHLFDAVSRYEEEFVELGELGKGGFGQVYKARNKFDQQEYAIKKIRFIDEKLRTKPHEVNKIMREVQSLAALQHPNVVHYNNAWMEHIYYKNKQAESTHHDTFKESSKDFHIPVTSNSFSNKSNSSWGDFSESKSTSKVGSKFWKIGDDDSESHSHNLTQNLKIVNYGSTKVEPSVNSKDLSVIRTPSIAFDLKMKRVRSFVINNSDQHYSSKINIMRGGNNSFGRSRSFNDLDHFQSEKEFLQSEVIPAPCEIILYIQMQICESSLDRWLVIRNSNIKSNNLSSNDIISSLDIYKQLLNALAYIHKKGILHRDLKPGNIFLNGERPHVLLGDFGLSRPMLSRNSSVETSVNDSSSVTYEDFDEHTSGIGTTSYAAPEQLTNDSYSFKADMYSAGVILFELTWVFHSGHEKSVCFKSLKRGKLPEDYSIHLANIASVILSLVSSNPENRPSAEELLKDSLFFSHQNDLFAQLSDEIKKLKTENASLRTCNDVYRKKLMECGVNPDELVH